MSKRKAKERKRQRQRQQHKRRSLHDKHRRRRKKDLMPNIPFLVAYQGDPAMGSYYFCNDVIRNGVHNYQLITRSFSRLDRYCMKGIASIFAQEGKILVKEAPITKHI